MFAEWLAEYYKMRLCARARVCGAVSTNTKNAIKYLNIDILKGLNKPTLNNLQLIQPQLVCALCTNQMMVGRFTNTTRNRYTHAAGIVLENASVEAIKAKIKPNSKLH